MKESYIEGLASHGVPESCTDDRKVGSEALTGACTGTVSSREIRQLGVPTPLSDAEGNTRRTALARGVATPRGRRPVARAELFCARTGRSHSHPVLSWIASGRPEAERR